MDNQNKFDDTYRIPSTRLPYWDYASNAAYFVTICARNYICFFGNVRNDVVQLSPSGEIAQKYWQEIPAHFPFVILDQYVIMPNHIHGIIIIDHDFKQNNQHTAEGRDKAVLCLPNENVSGRDKALPCLYNDSNNNFGKYRFQNQGKGSLSAIVGSFKSVVTKTINKNFPETNFGWQPRFYDHIIRSRETLQKIREYIYYNPMKWQSEKNNPENMYVEETE